MKNHLQIIALVTALFLLNSCKYFSNDDEEKGKEEKLKRVEKREIEANKEFQFINQSIAYETNISKDTVAIILKEYYKNYCEFVFDDSTKKFKEIDIYSQFKLAKNDEKTKMDFIYDIVKKQSINEKSAYLVFNKIEYFFNDKNIKEELEYIESEVDDLKPND